METSYFIGLLGGLALFLYGMELMSKGLELVAGTRLRIIIETMTSNLFKAILVGTVVTAIIQSSSATTVMVVGFVNAGVMNIYQAVGIIMGANIGTTITGQLVALNITSMAPLIAFIGFVLFTFSKKKVKKYFGQVVIGLGFLFMGMGFMSESMAPLQNNPDFISLMTKFSNPILGVLVGTGITAIIQSSSASVGILQAIANQGLIPLSSSMFIVCGFNIGTCITSVLSAIGTSKNAQRTAVVHVLFNLIGTIIFVVLSLFIPIEKIVIHFSRTLPAAQVANLHTIFNIGTTIILLPFSRKLADLSKLVIVGRDKAYDEMSLQYINPEVKKEPTLMLTDIKAEINRMFRICNDNFMATFSIIGNFDDEKYEHIYQREEVINLLNKEITRYIITGLGKEMDEMTSNVFAGYLRVVRDLERVGDHCKNIAEEAKLMDDEILEFTPITDDELKLIRTHIEDIFRVLSEDLTKHETDIEMKKGLERVQKDVEVIRNSHMDRMKEGICNPESGLVYEKMLTAFERIASYLSNAIRLSYD
ncbi:Na/Pi cotransporter family protein [Peptoniphilus raoultii]|uniref:Na/Pi cotransporter family protein n=1 Tax=Peptoniphilus raoultii TaxID=1776387 RepID=UPI0008D9F417|nr:Na/Pi cotransporter family protein [Peptoniphilus raoultii]